MPFIRLGDAGSDSKINIHDDFYNDKYRPSMSEMDKIFWVSQNIHEFGNPDFVGFCHYRRNIMTAINNDLLEHVINYSQYKTFMPIPINQLIKNNYSYDFDNCSILLDYKLFGLELHYDLILDYVKENYSPYIVKRTNEVLNSSSVSQNFCELYICKWDKFLCERIKNII